MIRALYTAASGMSAQQANLDTVANNLANSATAGFRRRRLQFEDMIYQNMITPGSPESQQTTAAGLQIGLGTRSAATEMVMTQGDFNQTGNAYDLAIQGPASSRLRGPTEPSPTRGLETSTAIIREQSLRPKATQYYQRSPSHRTQLTSPSLSTE